MCLPAAAARFWFSLEACASFAARPGERAASLIAAAVALLLYVGVRRSRYFGNTAPLLMVLLLIRSDHDAGRYRAVAVGAAVPVYVYRRRLCGCAGDPAAQAVPRH